MSSVVSEACVAILATLIMAMMTARWMIKVRLTIMMMKLISWHDVMILL